jgi:hypothetical protein
MNTKVPMVIAVELGILIVTLAGLAFSNFSRVKQPTLAQEQEPAENSFATVTWLPRPANPRHSATDNFTDQQRQQLAAQQQAQSLQYGTMQYDQQLAPAPYTSADVNDSLNTGTSPYYAGAYPQPVTSPDSFGWPYDPVLAFPPTSGIIVISNAQAFVRLGRVAPRFARPPMMVVHSRPRGVIPRRISNPPSFRPSTGLRPR